MGLEGLTYASFHPAAFAPRFERFGSFIGRPNLLQGNEPKRAHALYAYQICPPTAFHHLDDGEDFVPVTLDAHPFMLNRNEHATPR